MILYRRFHIQKGTSGALKRDMPPMIFYHYQIR